MPGRRDRARPDRAGMPGPAGPAVDRSVRPVAAETPRLVVEVRQTGLIIGVKFAHEMGGMLMTKLLFDNGVWAMFAGFDRSVLQVKPGLLMGQADIDAVMAAFDRACTGGGGVVKQVLQRLEANLDPAHPTGSPCWPTERSLRPFWCRVWTARLPSGCPGSQTQRWRRTTAPWLTVHTTVRDAGSGSSRRRS